MLGADAVLQWRWAKDLSFQTHWAQGGGHSATMLAVKPTPGGASMLTNVSLGGGGMLDGQGFMWWSASVWPAFPVFDAVHMCSTDPSNTQS